MKIRTSIATSITTALGIIRWDSEEFLNDFMARESDGGVGYLLLGFFCCELGFCE